MASESAWGKVKVRWHGTYAVGFDCPCGEEELQATDEEAIVCDRCGREYRMNVLFTVAEIDAGWETTNE